MTEAHPPSHALSGNHPTTGRPVLQTLPNRCLDDAIARMAVAGFRDIRVMADTGFSDAADI